jgi:hypothetical protein
VPLWCGVCGAPALDPTPLKLGPVRTATTHWACPSCRAILICPLCRRLWRTGHRCATIGEGL